MNELKKLFARLIFGLRYKRAVRKAVHMNKQSGRKFFVILMKGKPVVVSKQDIKYLVATRHFKKGVKLQDIEKRALFITK